MQEEMRWRTREAPMRSWLEGFMNQVGRREAAICHWGVLSGIVLRGWESQPHVFEAQERLKGKGKDLTEARSSQRKLVPDM
jgi:hypothetical protein